MTQSRDGNADTREFIVHGTDANFQEVVLKADLPVVVDFWAPWCAPCTFLGQNIEQLEPRYRGRLQVVKINVDENPQVAGMFGIRSIPTMVFFRDGQPIGGITGALPVEALEELFTRHVENRLQAEEEGEEGRS